MTRLILADDHTILRDGIRALLSAEPDLEVVGEASNGAEVLALLETTPADVVLMDVQMPLLDGFATMPELRLRFPEVRVLVLTMLDHENYVARMLEAGALGYVLKNAAISEITHAIRTVAAGNPFLCTEIGLNMLHKAVAQRTGTEELAAEGNSGADLTARELEVLKLIAEGLTNGEIADKLFTSKRTIETHRQNIIAKTQAKNTAALIKLAVSRGLISKKLFELAEFENSFDVCHANPGVGVGQTSVVFFGQSAICAQPGKGALDNPAPGMNAEIGFFDQHMDWFLHSDAVAVGQVLAKNAVERTVDEHDLHLAQQVVLRGHRVPESDGGRAIGGIGWQHPAGQDVAQRVGQHQTLAAFDELARVEAHRGPGGRSRIFHALRVEDDGRGAGFFSARSRPLTFRQVLTRCHVPSASHLAKYQYTVPQGGKSPGKSRHTHPFLSTYKMAFTTSTSGHLPRRRTTKSGANCCQSRAGKSELYRFRVACSAACFIQLN